MRIGLATPTTIVSFSPAIPYPGIEHAGGQYLRRLQDALTSQSQVTWLTQDRPSVRHAFLQPGVTKDVVLLADHKSTSHWRRTAYRWADRIETLWRKLDSQPTPLGPSLDILTRRDVRAAIRTADVIDFQWAAWTRLAPLVRVFNRRAKLIFTFHDVMSQKCDRESAKAPDPVRRLKWRLAGLLARAWERRALSIADVSVVFSQKDRELLDPRRRHNVVVVHPPLADGAKPMHSPNELHRVLLVGYMARQENVDALLWFAREIWPQVRRQIPDAQFHVVGGSMPQEQLDRFAQNPDGIFLRGFVEDLQAEYAAANVVVVPLLHGAGVKFKTIEALLAGVPVVTTPIGAEGIGGPELFHGHTNNPDEFAARVVSALSNAQDEANRDARMQQSELWALYSTEAFKDRALATYSIDSSPMEGGSGSGRATEAKLSE